jgi:hypothetical protein
MDKITPSKIETRICTLCGNHRPSGHTCDCEGVRILTKLLDVGGILYPLKYAHLYREEYEALRTKIINLYTKEEFNFDDDVGKFNLIRNNYFDNFKCE